MPEWEFLVALAAESGCALLFDINNLYVNAINHGFDPYFYLQYIPPQLVQEIHLAGHSVRRVGTRELLIDTHAAPVCSAVWDADLPALDVMIAESVKLDDLLRVRRADAA
jgi:hypothetical protein